MAIVLLIWEEAALMNSEAAAARRSGSCRQTQQLFPGRARQFSLSGERRDRSVPRHQPIDSGEFDVVFAIDVTAITETSRAEMPADLPCAVCSAGRHRGAA
jgi:hypothetical protein